MTLTTAGLNGRAHTGVMADDDLDPAARPKRRSFTAEYKAEILAEYDSHPKGSSERGAILRRDGLYSSHISEWRKQAEAGAREGLARNTPPKLPQAAWINEPNREALTQSACEVASSPLTRSGVRAPRF